MNRIVSGFTQTIPAHQFNFDLMHPRMKSFILGLSDLFSCTLDLNGTFHEYFTLRTVAIQLKMGGQGKGRRKNNSQRRETNRMRNRVWEVKETKGKK